MRHAASQVTEELFPETLAMAGATLPLKYRFAPGHPLDGLTLTVPLRAAQPARRRAPLVARAGHGAGKSRAVPEGAAEGVARPARPARRRRHRFPDAGIGAGRRIADRRAARLSRAAARRARSGRPFRRASSCRRTSRSTSASSTPPAPSSLPAATSRRCAPSSAKPRSSRSPPRARRSSGRACARGTSATCPRRSASCATARKLTGYPALVDDETSVSLTLLDTREAALAATRAGVLRLMRLALRDALSRHEKGAAGFAQAALQLKTAIGTDRLLADVLAAVVDRAFLGDDPLPRDDKAFAEQVKRARTRLPAVAEGAFRLLAAIAAEHHAVTQRLGGRRPGPGALRRQPVGRARRARLPGFLRRDAVGAACAPAALPEGAGASLRSPSGTARPRCPACGRVGGVRVALPRTGRARAGGRGAPARRPRGFPVAAGGAQGFPVRAGAAYAVPGVVEAYPKSME